MKQQTNNKEISRNKACRNKEVMNFEPKKKLKFIITQQPVLEFEIMEFVFDVGRVAFNCVERFLDFELR